MDPSASGLFYEDEDKILPLLLHAVGADEDPCSCLDCLGIRVRMVQLELGRSVRHSEAA